MILLDSLSLAYIGEAQSSLVDVGAAIPAGLTALVGGNGSGKTTLGLTCVAAIPHWLKAVISSGSCRLLGRPTAESDFGRTTYSLFQGLADNFLTHTMEEELLLMGTLPCAEWRDVLFQALPAKTPFASMSRGERGLAAAILALAKGRAVTFLDEAFASLDSENEQILANLLVSGRQPARAIIVSGQVRHSLPVAADRTLFMSKGRLSTVRPLDSDSTPLQFRPPSHHGPPLLRADGICAHYGSRQVLRDASLELKTGEVVALTGRNGTGKSTLLRILAGLQAPSGGEVRFNSRRATGKRLREAARLCSSDPDAELFESSAEREIASEPRVWRLAAKLRLEVVKRFLWSLPFAGDADPAQLSFGRRKLLQLACAFAGDPEVLLLDEPTSGLDSDGVRRLAAWVDDFLSVGAHVVVMASQTGDDVVPLCERELRISNCHVL